MQIHQATPIKGSAIATKAIIRETKPVKPFPIAG
jgi:hypothetical protein